MLSTIKPELLKYGETTSIRGISKLIKSKDIFLKILWLLFFLVSTSVMIYLLVTLYQKFYTWPVNTKYGEKRDESISFPDVTLCNLDIFAEGEPEELSVSNYTSYVRQEKKKMTTALEKESSKNETIREWFHFVDLLIEKLDSVSGYIINLRKDRPPSTDCPNFIADCKFFEKNWQRSNVACSVENFTREWNVNYYTCYTLRTSTLNIPNSKTIKGLSLVLNVGPPSLKQVPFKPSLTNSQARGVQVSVHSSGTPPDLKRGFSAAPGTENIVDIVQTDKIRLNKPYNPLGCTSRAEMPNSPSEKYTCNLCIEYCLQKTLKDECGCVLPALAFPNYILNDTVLCGNFSVQKFIGKETVEESQDFKIILNSILKLLCSLIRPFLVTEHDLECMENCLLPCEETVYDVYLTSSSWPQPATQLDIFNKYFVKPNCLNTNPKVRSRYSNYLKFYYDYQNDSSVEISQSNLMQIKESLLEIKFVMKQNFPYYQSESAAYTWDVMIGTVGGMLSLWLGITVASGMEIIELVYLLIKSYNKSKNSAPATMNDATNTKNSEVVESNFDGKIKK